MKRGRILVEAEIEYLRDVPKPIHDARWRSKLLPPSSSSRPENAGSDVRGRFQLNDLPNKGLLQGKLHLYYRRSLQVEETGDWSVGLIYTNIESYSYPVIRCNGPHLSIHTNRIESNHIPSGSTHIHYLTERYQRLKRPKPDGYAEVTNAYVNADDAVTQLIDLVNLKPSLTLDF